MKRLLALLVVLAGIGGGTAVWLRRELFTARHKGFGEPVFFEIEKGAPTRVVGEELARLGVLRAGWHLLAMRTLHPTAKIQAGDYQFAEAASAAEVFDRLRRGDIYTREFLVPEGSDIFDIAELAEKQGLAKAEDFLAAARNPALIADLDPLAPSLEGYLFPSTYRFRRKVTAQDICLAMTQQFRKVWRSLGSGAGVHRTVVLASFVEKEAKLPDERALIAGVYANRLAQGMKLDCDPTVIYASLLAGKWKGTIHRSDLDRESPYNTYLKPGLPPGPIANPGLKSLEAALEPADNGDLFFVARPDGSGGHIFSRDSKSHAKAVVEYRNGVKAASNQGVARKPRAR
jgi:UPF0755 protein